MADPDFKKTSKTNIKQLVHVRVQLEVIEYIKFEARYDRIVENAKEEYEYIPATNNEAERLLRGYKRKQKQAVTFRSFGSIPDIWIKKTDGCN